MVLGCSLAAVTGGLTMAQTSAQPGKDDLFAGTEKCAQRASSVTQIDMDPSSLHEVEGKNGTRARSTVLEVVHTYTYDQPGMYKIADVEQFRNKLQSSEWHCSVHIFASKTGNSTDICNKHRTDELREEAIITASPKSLTFIHTIRREGPRSDAGGSVMSLPMRFIGPEVQAEMAIARAEMQVEMATIGPQVQAQLAQVKVPDAAEMNRLQQEMKEFHGPDPEEMKRLQEELKGMLDKKQPDRQQGPK